MQAMFKSELAKLAGVSSRTFRRYLATRRAILTAMGVSPFARKLPPQAVHYISEDYCIDIPPCAIVKNLIKRIFFWRKRPERDNALRQCSTFAKEIRTSFPWDLWSIQTIRMNRSDYLNEPSK